MLIWYFSNNLDIYYYVGKLPEQHFSVWFFSNPRDKILFLLKFDETRISEWDIFNFILYTLYLPVINLSIFSCVYLPLGYIFQFMSSSVYLPSVDLFQFISSSLYLCPVIIVFTAWDPCGDSGRFSTDHCTLYTVHCTLYMVWWGPICKFLLSGQLRKLQYSSV